MDAVDLFSRLPEGCISHILSFTTPRDAARSATVCWVFRSASESDVVWKRFLPLEYSDILARSGCPLDFSSMKELYIQLCDPIIIDDDGGKLSFSLEKMTGKKCYMLSAKKLAITWGNTQMYWKWASRPESRFPEVAELLSVCWLEIRGKIDAHMLSPKTTYKAYLIHKLAEGAYGLNFPPAEMSVKLGGQASNHTAILQPDITPRIRPWNVFNRLSMWRHEQAVTSTADGQFPQARSDGWKEIEMGEFFNDIGEEGEVEVSLMEVNGGNWKSGLIIEGIEIRPMSK